MKPVARWSIAAAISVLLGVVLLSQGDHWEETPTSYGAIPEGYGALYELLSQLGLSKGRSFAEGEGLPEGATVWWISPRGLCERAETGDLSDAESGVWRSLPWVERGGTAVIFLPEWPEACLRDVELGGVRMPFRVLDVAHDRSASGAPHEAPTPSPGKPGAHAAAEPGTIVEGPLDPEPRALGPGMASFHSSAGFQVLAWDQTGGALVVSRELGAGRLVFVSTALPLRNQWLDHGDASLLAVDLATALGPPLFDEREHGLLPSPRAVPYLLRSAALPAFAGVALLALLMLWWGRAPLPSRTDPEVEPPPSLEGFVASIAALYAGTRDHAEVLRCYQELALGQLRRIFLLAPDTPARNVRDRVLASRELTEADVDLLFDAPRARRKAELLGEVARIDALVVRVAR